MPSGQKLSGPANKDHLESKRTPSLSTSQPVDLTPSNSLLTEENVKKLQEEESASKCDLTRESIEAYITQSNLFLNQSGASTSQSKEQTLPDVKESNATSAVIHVEDVGDGVSGKIERSSKKDSQARSPSISSLESQTSMKAESPTIKCGVTDVETQTEWSYSESSSEEKKRSKVEQKRKSIKESRKGEESEELIVLSILEKKEVSEVISEAFQESSEEDEQEIEDHSETDLCHIGCCEFCEEAMKSLPTAEYLDEKPDKMEWLMCCRTYKEIFKCVIQEMMENTPTESEIDITPHPHQLEGYYESGSKTKRTLIKQIEDKGGIEKYREVFEQYIMYGTCMKLRFKLSDYPPKPKKVLKKHPEPKEILILDLEFKAEHLKVCHSTNPVKRYYSDGKIFYLFFPDGTGQVYYPSGNVAILITYIKEVQFTYIVLKDSLSYEMQACFANQGFAVCYHRNGKIWLNLDLCFGSYFDRKGVRKKHWNWWDKSSHIHAPPFQSIYIQLNVYIQVKIEAQDQIFLTFTNNHDCLELNVGAKLRPIDPDTLKFLRRPASSGQLVPSNTLQIKRLLANMQKLLKELSLVPPEETNYFYFLVSDMYDHVHRRKKMRARSMER